MATGLPTFAPIIQAAVIFPYAQPDQQAGLRYYYIEGVLVLVGTFLYTVGHDSSFLEKQPGTEWLTNAQSRIPESWRPVTFDIWGASHQVFHISLIRDFVCIQMEGTTRIHVARPVSGESA